MHVSVDQLFRQKFIHVFQGFHCPRTGFPVHCLPLIPGQVLPHPSLHLFQQAVVPESDLLLAFQKRFVQPGYGAAHFPGHLLILTIRDVAALQLPGQEEIEALLFRIFFPCFGGQDFRNRDMASRQNLRYFYVPFQLIPVAVCLHHIGMIDFPGCVINLGYLPDFHSP